MHRSHFMTEKISYLLPLETVTSVQTTGRVHEPEALNKILPNSGSELYRIASDLVLVEHVNGHNTSIVLLGQFQETLAAGNQ